jgi:hypothetical protein
MGSGICRAADPALTGVELGDERRPVWKFLPSEAEAKRKYEEEGTLTKKMDASFLELRTLLDDPMAQHALGIYTRECHVYECFMLWVDIQEYKSIPTEDYRRSKAMHIWNKYLKRGAPAEYGGLEDADCEHYEQELEESKHDKSILHARFFDKVCIHMRLTIRLTSCNNSLYCRSS